MSHNCIQLCSSHTNAQECTHTHMHTHTAKLTVKCLNKTVFVPVNQTEGHHNVCHMCSFHEKQGFQQIHADDNQVQEASEIHRSILLALLLFCCSCGTPLTLLLTVPAYVLADNVSHEIYSAFYILEPRVKYTVKTTTPLIPFHHSY